MTAAERIQKFMSMHRSENRIIGADLNAAVSLTFSDLREVLADLKRTRERCWSLCPGDEFHGRTFERTNECPECGMTESEYKRQLNPEGFEA